MRSHTQERLVACPTCGSMFASNTKFFDHLHRQADPVGKKDFFFCVLVLLVLLEKNHFCARIHTESLVCEHCGKAFSRERLLRDHVRQHGKIIRAFVAFFYCVLYQRCF